MKKPKRSGAGARPTHLLDTSMLLWALGSPERLSPRARRRVVNHVSPGWFRAFNTPILTGRDFTNADRRGGQPVAIVNETFALKFLNRASPLGHTITGLGPDVQIVGMARDAVYRSLRDPVPATVYLPFGQSREVTVFGSMSLSVRSSEGSPSSLVRSVTAALNTVNPDLT